MSNNLNNLITREELARFLPDQRTIRAFERYFAESTTSNIGQLEYQSYSGVPGSTETEIFSYTNSTGASLFLDEIAGEGNARSEWEILFDDVTKTRARSSVSDHNISLPYYNFELESNSTVKIKVTHYESSSADYSVTLKFHA